MERLGLKQQGLYLLRSDGTVTEVPFRNGFGIDDVSLAPQRTLIAYTGRSGENGMQYRVVVATLDGDERASIPGALTSRWSPRGEHLALQFIHYDREWKASYDSVGVWETSTGRMRTYRQGAVALCWSAGDSLLLSFGDHVAVLDVHSGRTRNAAHAWPFVSPDGRYSLGYGGQYMQSYRLRDERDGLELWGCAMHALGFEGMGDEAYLPPPFWVRSAGAAHLLCVAVSGSHTSPPKQAGCITTIFDPRTLAFLMRMPGKLVAPTPDYAGAVILVGDTLRIIDYAGLRAPEPRDTTSARVLVAVEQWGDGQRWPVRSFTYRVQEGDWIPDHSGFDGGCEKYFHVDRVVADSVFVSLGRSLFTDKATRHVLTRAPLQLTTDSRDGGTTLSLSVVPR
jgi:hypothetical protein